MKAKFLDERVDREGISDVPVNKPKKKRNFDLRKGMIMKVILDPPRAKKNWMNRYHLP